MPIMVGAFLTMHFGSKPMSFVGTPLPVPPLPMRLVADDVRVKSGLLPSAAVKNDAAPVPVTLFDQPEVGCP